MMASIVPLPRRHVTDMLHACALFLSRRYMPEAMLVALFLVFVVRELGTFPSPWQDDSLFMIVARSLASGRGYVLPTLRMDWQFPYILGIGPTVLVPVALSIKLFGWSVAAARIPMVLYLAGTTVLVHRFTHSIAGRGNAWLATALLITLSAFINNGKPVLGEVPGLFFFLLGIRECMGTRSKAKAVRAGLWFGLAIVTKVTFGLLFPAMAVTFLMFLLRRDWPSLKQITLIGTVALGIYVSWHAVEMIYQPGMLQEVSRYLFTKNDTGFLSVLRTHPRMLLRFQYVYLGGLLVLGAIGMGSKRREMSQLALLMIGAFVALDILYFLSREGWYRHILPAHIAILPFVPTGMARLVGKKIMVAGVVLLLPVQGWWQWTYHGSLRTDEASVAAQQLVASWSNTAMVIESSELFVHLPPNPHWFYLSEELRARDFALFPDLPLRQEEHCLPLVRKMSTTEQQALTQPFRILERRFVLMEPPPTCKTP